MQTEYVLAAFRSRQQVQQFVQWLHQAGVQADIVNTPHRIAIGCGVSARFGADDTDRAREVYELRCRGGCSSFVGFYGISHDGGQIRVTPLYRRFLQ